MTTKTPALHHRKAIGSPEGYMELRTFLPERSKRRLVLGVAENTLISWDENRASRVRKDHERKVAMWLFACQRMQPFFPEPAAVSTFLTTPQVSLWNREPYALIRRLEERGVEIVTCVVADDARRAAKLRDKLGLELALGDDAAWDAIRKGLSDSAIRRLDAAAAESSAARRKRGTRDMLG